MPNPTNVVMARELAVALIPAQFSVANIKGEVIAELFVNRFNHTTVMGYTLQVYSKSAPTEEDKYARQLMWNPTEESVLKLVRELEGPQTVRRSARLIDGDEEYLLLDQPYAVQVSEHLWEVTFYYQEEE